MKSYQLVGKSRLITVEYISFPALTNAKLFNVQHLKKSKPVFQFLNRKKFWLGWEEKEDLLSLKVCLTGTFFTLYGEKEGLGMGFSF